MGMPYFKEVQIQHKMDNMLVKLENKSFFSKLLISYFSKF